MIRRREDFELHKDAVHYGYYNANSGKHELLFGEPVKKQRQNNTPDNTVGTVTAKEVLAMFGM
jgi:hypothetical protein